MRQAFTLLLLVTISAQADLDMVRTRDGRWYEGRLQLTAGDAVMITSRGAEPVIIPIRELKIATRQPPVDAEAKPASASSSIGTKTTDLSCTIQLRHGSQITGVLRAIDPKRITCTRNGEAKTLPREAVAKIIFSQALPGGAETNVQGHRGALLDTGDVLDGEFRDYTAGRATFSSVLFGNKTLTAGKDLVAIIFADVKLARATCTVRTTDGSLFYAKSIHTTGNQTTIEDSMGDQWTVPADEVLEIKGEEEP